ncbi:MAG TPA: DNA internalization-related competence protein ComEC/Rec2 [Sedimentisphaerales bacterium]|nr:DNA internalization-related competence protein ComEC/Rec2 [Sedimentisphaerales bacterium]
MDDIQRKLALIDQQLAGRNLHRQIISTCPLVFIAVGLIAGILIQSTLLGTRFLWLWLILLSQLTAATVFFFIIQQSSSNHHSQLTTHNSLLTTQQYATAYLALACFVCLGAIRMISFHQPKPNDISNLVTDEQKLATIRGLIVTEPYVNKNRNWEFARFKFTDPVTSFYLKLNEVETTHGWAKATGTVRVQVDEPVLDLKTGDYIQAYCRLDRFSPPTNPGQFDVAKYLARKNVFIAASVKSRDGIELLQSTPPAVFTKLKRMLRQSAAQALLGNVSPEEPSRGLLEALLLGYRGNIDSSTYRAFRRTGLLHFISLSGMHLGILVGIIWWLCKTAGLMKPARAVICIIAISIFLLIVPPRAPTLRAAIICLVFCVSFFFHRYSNPINTLSLAAIILLLIRPTQLFEAGWQLSFGTVLGILLFANRIHFFLYEKVTSLPWRKERPKTKLFLRILSKPGPYLLRLFSIGMAAWLGGAGILLYHFYTITPLASIWTVLVFPLVSAILVLGFLKIILFFLLPTLSAILGIIVALLSSSLIWIVKLIAHLDISEILIGQVPLALIILYYCFVLFTGFVYFKRPLIKKAICTVLFLILIVFLGAAKWQRTYRDNLVITCLDVGNGQAIFAQLPGKANVLFDAGSLHKSDIGGRVIAPFLDRTGINKIDAIIISHNDIDHVNGIPRIAEHCKVSGVYANKVFFDKADQWSAAKFLNDCLIQKGIKIQPLDTDLILSGSANIKILWPIEQIFQNEDLGDNDKSLVSLIEFAGTEILLCSDIENFAQRELLRLYPDLKADIVVVPHHGSVNTLEANFLEKLNADILIYSCDRTQYERKQQMIKGKTSVRSFYTPKHGAVSVYISSDGVMEIKTFVP